MGLGQAVNSTQPRTVLLLHQGDHLTSKERQQEDQDQQHHHSHESTEMRQWHNVSVSHGRERLSQHKHHQDVSIRWITARLAASTSGSAP